MPSLVTFLLRRLAAILATFLVVTLLLYGVAMLTPPETRAQLYMPQTNRPLTEEQIQRLTDLIIKRYGLDQPYPVQYTRWLVRVFQGEWGYSPTAKQDVLAALLQRTPASAELVLYSIALFIPLGVVAGLASGRRRGRRGDTAFRLAAFSATSLPPFILAILLLAIFYVGVYWFPIGRLSTLSEAVIRSPDYTAYTGLVTIDGLLNGRFDVTLDGLRHLVLPVFTLSLAHWGTLGRVTRVATVDELSKEYVLAARAHGVSERKLLWRHVLRNVLVPALNTSALSAASLVTGLFVIEIIFTYNGISSLFVQAFGSNPDIAASLGFAVYCVIAVMLIMTVLDVLQALVDPRIREGGLLS